MNNLFAAPTPEEHAALLQEIGPLPLSGQAWPDWVRILAWIVLAVIGVQIVTTAIGLPPGQVNPILAGTIILCFLGLALVSWHMQISVTRIDESGLRQTWITRREVAWQDIQFAKFVPLLFSSGWSSSRAMAAPSCSGRHPRPAGRVRQDFAAVPPQALRRRPATDRRALRQRIGSAYIRPPWVHCAFRPRWIFNGLPWPTLRSKLSP